MNIIINKPSSWEIVQIKDICKIHGGKPAPKEDNAFSEDGIPFVRMKDLGSYHQTTKLYKTCDKINHEYAKIKKMPMIPKGSILLPRSGSVALNHRAILAINAIIVSHILALEVLNEKVSNKYLYFALCQTDFAKITKKTTGLDAITFDDLKKIKIPLPPLEVQQKIAAVLDKADRLRQLRKAAIEKLDQLIQSVFLDMFGDPVTNPKGWEVSKLKEVGKVTTGNTPSRNRPEYYGDYIEWIKSDNINTPSDYLTTGVEYLSEKGMKVGRVAPKDSILVTCIAGSKQCIGNAAIANRIVSFNQQINAILPSERINPYYLYMHLRVGKKLVQNASTNGMKGIVNKSKFENIRIINPPLNEQNNFGMIFKKIESMKENMGISLNKFNDTFNSLLQRAFKGELEFNEAYFKRLDKEAMALS